jgi:murein DD-endopeptidase MepM/ murein hydrolase activator NlpD
MNSVSVIQKVNEKREQGAPLEKLIMNKEFCIWVVPPQNGRVRKLRFSWRHIFCSLVALSAFSVVFFLIAGDYVRVQAIRAKNYLIIKSVSSQLDSFRAQNQELNTKLETLSGTQQKLRQYETEVRKKVDELGAILEAATTIGLVDVKQANIDYKSDKKVSQKTAAQSTSRTQGIGGLELDCSGDGLEGCIESLSEMDLVADPDTLSIVKGKDVPNDQLISTLSSYIGLLRSIPLGYPVSGEITSGFGFRISPFSGKPKMHQGVDFSLPRGSYIYATAYGKVEKVERSGTYGLQVDINHGQGVITRYAHLSRVMVKEGQELARGEIVGHVGSSGRSTGPHLHYEVRIANKAKNPNKFMELAYRLNTIL